MRCLPLPILLVISAACGDETLTVRGTLLPGSSATDVYVVGEPPRGAIDVDSFAISGITGEVVELEFADEDDRLGRMRIEGWTGTELILRGIWLEDGVAFATDIEGEGAATINALRMLPDAALPRSVAADGIVLAVSGDGDALIVRPDDARLPDLRVVVTPGTSVEEENGEPADTDFEFGDSLRVEGTTEGSYVVATALVVLRGAAAEEMPVEERGSGPIIQPGEEDEEDGGDEADREERRAGPRSLTRPGGGKGRGRGLQPRD